MTCDSGFIAELAENSMELIAPLWFTTFRRHRINFAAFGFYDCRYHTVLVAFPVPSAALVNNGDKFELEVYPIVGQPNLNHKDIRLV
jgi:hypothetical protein